MQNRSAAKLFSNLLMILAASALMAGGPPLDLVWETGGLNNPESVIYHRNTNALYVSNVNGTPNEKDGNGYIAKLSLDGEILEQQWITGFDAPKGLAISGNKLYVADIDTLVEIDIQSARITNQYTVEDAKFLNDVAAAANGDIYVSDMILNRIHRLHRGKFNIWLESPDLLNPNGLLVQDDQLIVGAWGIMKEGFATEIPGHMLSVTISSKAISSMGDGSSIGNLDGVEGDGMGGYYVTDWMAGRLFHIDNAGNPWLILQLEQGMADHEVLLDQKLILLPMMMNDKLLAYRIR